MRKHLVRLAGAALAAGLIGVAGVSTAAASPAPAVIETVTVNDNRPMQFKEAIIKTYVSGARTAYCNWPYRAAINWNGQGTISAYSPSGWYLGARYYDYTGYWYTPWEDVYFSYYTTGSYVNVRCYW